MKWLAEVFLLRLSIRIIGLLLVLFVLASCSSNPPLELSNVSSKIVQNESLVGSIGITEGDRKGEKLVPTALYYEFKIRNTSNKPIGRMDPEKGIQITLEPKEKLKSASTNIIGFNIFHPEAYIDTGLGTGQTIWPILEAGEESDFALYYLLGVSEENPDVPILVPSKEDLEALKEFSFHAYVVLSVENEEIARFDLEKIEK